MLAAEAVAYAYAGTRGPFPLLSMIIFLPILTAIGIMFLPERRSDTARYIGIVGSFITFGLTIWLFLGFKTDFNTGNFQWIETHRWIPSLGIGYRLAVDGFSLFMILLTGFLFPLMLIGSRHITKRLKHYVIFILFLEAAQIGVFAATDAFLFFIFWELTLIPVYFLIGYWGGKDRLKATVKFVMFTAAGSAFLLAAVVGAGMLVKGQPSFNWLEMFRTNYSLTAQRWLFWGFTIGFLVKVPVVPFHTWLPDAHTQAPTAGSADLAGVLLKLGTFGMLRYSIPLFPRAAVEGVPILLTLAVLGIVFAALVAIRQKDAKRLIAYTSVSHMGFVVMGIFALTTTGVAGGVLQMLNHGIATAGLFFLIGFFYDRRHTHEIAAFGGLKNNMPVYAGCFLFVAFASAGLPGLNGFVGEMMTMFGTFPVHRWWAIIAATGMVWAGIYLLWLYQRAFAGKIENPDNKSLKDLQIHEILVIAPIIVLILVLGVYPKPVLDRIVPTAARLVATVEVRTAGTAQAFREPASTASDLQVRALTSVVAELKPVQAALIEQRIERITAALEKRKDRNDELEKLAEQNERAKEQKMEQEKAGHSGAGDRTEAAQ